MKRILLALLAATMVVASGTTAFAHRGHDDGGKAKERVFTLAPDPASSPEGIDFDKRTRSFYVSITGLSPATSGGDIYRGRLGSDKVEPFIPGGTGKNAVGVEEHGGKLYVAGGPSGAITVYDLKSKEAVATFQTGAGGFLNDLVVTKRGDVYVTDSLRPTLWHVTGDQVKAGGGTPQALDLSGGITYAAGFNLNGIVAKGSHRLVVVQTNAAKLFRIDLNDDGDAIDAIDEIEGVSLARRRDDPRSRPARRGHRQPGAAQLRQARGRRVARGAARHADERQAARARRPSRARRTSTSW